MNTKDLERKDFWDTAYPKQSSKDFLNRVSQNWQNLEKGEFNKKGNAALRLYHEFKPAKGRINELTMFYLWLYLCLNRPWERNWKTIFSDKRHEKIMTKIDGVLSQLEITDKPSLQIQTLRKHTNRKDFKSVIAWAAVDPGISAVIGKIFIEGAKAFRKIGEGMAEALKNKHIDWKSLKLNFKFANYISSQKYVKKRDLMRKLAINKKLCELLLTEAVNQNFIKLQEFSQKTVWITYAGPKR